jgi:hypothetical protein
VEELVKSSLAVACKKMKEKNFEKVEVSSDLGLLCCHDPSCLDDALRAKPSWVL